MSRDTLLWCFGPRFAPIACYQAPKRRRCSQVKLERWWRWGYTTVACHARHFQPPRGYGDIVGGTSPAIDHRALAGLHIRQSVGIFTATLLHHLIPILPDNIPHHLNHRSPVGNNPYKHSAMYSPPPSNFLAYSESSCPRSTTHCTSLSSKRLKLRTVQTWSNGNLWRALHLCLCLSLARGRKHCTKGTTISELGIAD